MPPRNITQRRLRTPDPDEPIIAAYQHPKRSEGKKLMRKVISALRSSTMPKGLEEIK
ncbi:hypothetical protein [Corynebacterium maris]|uniref:hypothetical protein n=1 Tax=Corynebacterium maris TaxID=575200 RepID=UPI000425D6FB